MRVYRVLRAHRFLRRREFDMAWECLSSTAISLSQPLLFALQRGSTGHTYNIAHRRSLAALLVPGVHVHLKAESADKVVGGCAHVFWSLFLPVRSTLAYPHLTSYRQHHVYPRA